MANSEKESQTEVEVLKSKKNQKKKRKHRALKPSQKFSDQYSEVDTIQVGVNDTLVLFFGNFRKFWFTKPL